MIDCFALPRFCSGAPFSKDLLYRCFPVFGPEFGGSGLSSQLKLSCRLESAISKPEFRFCEGSWTFDTLFAKKDPISVEVASSVPWV